ncbi:MAG: hypothetical protein FJ104_05775 [Deltaproteobacteria bacterium]|nr:hypothetical protein [Deltaproteobacteria bacterium]
MRRSLPALLLFAVGCGTNEPALLPGVDAGAEPRPTGPGLLAGGDATRATLVDLYTPPRGTFAPDLEFNPVRPGELWVVLRRAHDGSPCDEPLPGTRPARSCEDLAGAVAIFADATSPAPTARLDEDPNSWHFMRLPTAIAFGDGDTFATAGEARTANWDDDPLDFMGPTLWSSDPQIFGIEPEGKNGSHLDMLHASPFGMGIAHERDNVYWVANGQTGSLDRYDFAAPHEIGGADHSDGRVWRWLDGELERVPGLPAHLAFDGETGLLYAVDAGHRRVISVDTASGRDDGQVGSDDGQLGPIPLRRDPVQRDLIAPGRLEAPSGIALAGGYLYVTDSATSSLVAFDLEGSEVARYPTGLPPGTLAGVAIGPDGNAYLGDLVSGTIRRLEAR